MSSEGEALFRNGINQAEATDGDLSDEEQLQRALMSREDQAYATARKLGMNLRGVRLQYAPDEFAIEQWGKVAKADPWTIKLSDLAFTDERTLGATIAHELAHARDYIQYGEATEEAGADAQRAFEEWYDGHR